MKKIYLDSIGCRLNISELEQAARLMQVAGWEVTDSPQQADLILMNTCTVTAKAGADSRQKIRQANRLSRAPIIVTGCWSTLEPEQAARLPGVAAVISNDDKDSLIERLLQTDRPRPSEVAAWLSKHKPRRLRTRSFIKVQDGCNNNCAYCITTIARGPSRSRLQQAILDEIHAAEQEGVQEIVLSGVHLGMWGKDLASGNNLTTLLACILQETHIPRIQISSLEPWGVPEGLFQLWKDPRLVKHLHMPLQSGSADVLRRMGRHVSPETFTALVAEIRAAIPDLALTTDLIAGFPGETDEDHQASMDLVRKLQFAGGHVFPYSERPETSAASMDHPVHHADRKSRAASLRVLLQQTSLRFRTAFLDSVQPVLWIQEKNGRLQGITTNDIKVFMQGPACLINTIQSVRLDKLEGSGLAAAPLPAKE
ncbi:MAG: MiaB/RimO family radical SAM methylthiotransferase [Anaerolineales bacterium]|nr:MiaB/RimO family radical SAM methylthiotransferase [Anaerolineales bacterium]